MWLALSTSELENNVSMLFILTPSLLLCYFVSSLFQQQENWSPDSQSNMAYLSPWQHQVTPLGHSNHILVTPL